MADQISGLLSPYLKNKRIKEVKGLLMGRVLDYGCGTGEMTKYCDSDKYYGFDRDKQSIVIAKKNYPHYNFSTDAPRNELFDTIIMLAVIEHMKEPKIILSDLSKLLNKNGKIILTTPHPKGEVFHKWGAHMGLFSKEANDEHEDLIDLNFMNKILEDTDLRVEKYNKFLMGFNQLFILVKINA